LKPISYVVPFGKVYVKAAGCIHFPLGERELLRKWVRDVATTPNCVTMLMGDNLDCARTKYQKHIRSYQADGNSQEALDAWYRKDVEALAQELMPIKDRIIGAISGNHGWTFLDGTTGDQFLCYLLGIPYLGPYAAVRLEFRDGGKKTGKLRHQLTMVAHHSGGSQGGRTTSGDLSALLRTETAFDADIYLLSHTHRRYGTKETTLTISRTGVPKVVERTKVFVRTGAFLKGFKADNPTNTAPHFPGYAELAAFRPTDLGYVTISIDLTRTNSKDVAQDIQLTF
jgi:hypothetical protein